MNILHFNSIFKRYLRDKFDKKKLVVFGDSPKTLYFCSFFNKGNKE